MPSPTARRTRCRPCGRSRSRRSREGTSLRFEVNLDQSSGETSTPKKVLETLLAIPPAEQLSLSVIREATLLS